MYNPVTLDCSYDFWRRAVYSEHSQMLTKVENQTWRLCNRSPTSWIHTSHCWNKSYSFETKVTPLLLWRVTTRHDYSTLLTQPVPYHTKRYPALTYPAHPCQIQHFSNVWHFILILHLTRPYIQCIIGSRNKGGLNSKQFPSVLHYYIINRPGLRSDSVIFQTSRLLYNTVSDLCNFLLWYVSSIKGAKMGKLSMLATL